MIEKAECSLRCKIESLVVGMFSCMLFVLFVKKSHLDLNVSQGIYNEGFHHILPVFPPN